MNTRSCSHISTVPHFLSYPRSPNPADMSFLARTAFRATRTMRAAGTTAGSITGGTQVERDEIKKGVLKKGAKRDPELYVRLLDRAWLQSLTADACCTRCGLEHRVQARQGRTIADAACFDRFSSPS